MAMRRPRIKAVANIQLNAKRKPKTTNDVKPNVNCKKDIVNEIHKDLNYKDTQINEETPELQTIEEPKCRQQEQEVRTESVSDTTANKNNLSNDIAGEDNFNKDNDVPEEQAKNDINNQRYENNLKDLQEVKDAFKDSDAFKCPPKVGYQRTISHTSNSGADDVFYSDIEENALQMDLQKSPNGFPMSPSKNQTRQRIRPTPHFGQRRNSFVGSSPSHNAGHDDNLTNNTSNEFVQPNQTPRRERHLSASLSGNSNSSGHHYHHAPHKYLPAGIANGGMGRIRTESGCSVYSDTNTSSHKSRKTEEHNHRQHSRREFEARFVNGVPDKSALKMSDLIYWNPATNPMEQKPNPNVKLEGTESSSNDVKPFAEKKEKDSDATAAATATVEAEAVPVPQLKLNSNGELILDDKSLVIETTAEQEARKVLANSSLIYLDENTGMNGFYSRQKRTREWPSSETIKFYRCLQNVGTDFSLMVSLFPNRTRRDLKLKFKKEEKINGHLINKALLYPKQFDIETLKQQVEEEEKAREELAQQVKIAKEKAKGQKRTIKKELKKKSCVNHSVASRVLNSAHDVYQNENTQKPKRAKKINTNIDNAEITDPTSEEINNGEADINGNTNKNILNRNIKIEEGVKDKRRRKRAPNNTQKEEIIIIKEEIIKTENKPDGNSLFVTVTAPPAEYNDVKQLETEMDELLQNNSEAFEETEEPSYMAITEEPEEENEGVEEGVEGDLEQEVDNAQEEEEDESSITTDSSHFIIDDTYYEDDNMDIDHYESRTYVNLDNGSVNTFNEVTTEQIPTSAYPTPLPPSSLLPPLPTPRSPSPEYTETQTSLSLAAPTSTPDIINNDDTCSSMLSERALNEQDIQQILTELAEGSLVLVSTLDPDDPDKVLNEIYMVDKYSGELCDEPLNIPDNIVQCILSVMS